jgi:hypothetical protein
MPETKKSPIASKIEQIGEHSDQILESAQSTVSKLGKRLLQIIGTIAVGSVLLYQAILAFQDKTKDVFNKSGIEKIEEKQGSTVFKVRGKLDPAHKDESRSQPEK